MSTWYATDAIIRQHRAELTADADRSRLRRPTPRRLRRRSDRDE
jgi:hypothetical protein